MIPTKAPVHPPPGYLAIQVLYDSVSQRRFDVHRTERIRVGKSRRLKNVPRIDHEWARWGVCHFSCPISLVWRSREFGIWVDLEIPFEPAPQVHLPQVQLCALLQNYGAEITQGISAQLPRLEPWQTTTLRLPSRPSAAPSPGMLPVDRVAADMLDVWVTRLAKGEAEFERAKRTLTDNLASHGTYYDGIADELRLAARFIDQIERYDGSPHLWVRDRFPSEICLNLEDLLSRSRVSSHGFQVAFQTVYSGASNASFPVFWKAWPPF